MKSLIRSLCLIALLLTVFVIPGFAESLKDEGYSPEMQAKIEEMKKELKKFTDERRP